MLVGWWLLVINGKWKHSYLQVFIYCAIKISDSKKPQIKLDNWLFRYIIITPKSFADGFSVAETKHLRVFRNIFMQVYAPYAMKRREQTSLRVAIFNYGDEDTEVSSPIVWLPILCQNTCVLQTKQSLSQNRQNKNKVKFLKTIKLFPPKVWLCL